MTISTFPSFPGLAFPVKRTGPTFDTVIQDAISGKQTAYPKRVTPKWTWELPFEFLRSAAAYGEMQTLAGFYGACMGRAYAFGYTDAEDNAVVAQQFGAGDGVSVAFQLVRTFGGFTEPVFLPTGTPTITIGGATAVAGTDYTIGATGVVTFTTAPAASAALVWTGSFNWLCRFDDDQVAFSRFMTGLWAADKVSFTSIIA